MGDRTLAGGNVDTAPQLLTAREAARMLRISRNLAYELVARHELPAIRLGRVIRIPRAELEAWLVAQASRNGGAAAPDA